MPISGKEFDEGKPVEKKDLSEVMDPVLAYTTPEVAELIGRSWGIAKGMLEEGEQEGNVERKKIGRSVYWKFIGEPA